MLSTTKKINVSKSFDLSMIFKGKVRSILTAKPDRFGARLLPQQPHTNEELTVEVVGKVPEEAPSQAGVDCRVSTLQALTCCEW